MGCGASRTAEEETNLAHSKEIDAELRKEQRQAKSVFKLLLLGTIANILRAFYRAKRSLRGVCERVEKVVELGDRCCPSLGLCASPPPSSFIL